MKRNMICHYREGTSDKVYMACIRDLGEGKLNVVGKWGRRGRRLKEMVYLRTAGNVSAAVEEQNRLFREKLKEGYIDIDDPSYRGVVSRSDSEIREAMELGEETSVTPVPNKPRPPKPPKVTPPPPPPEEKDFIVVCENNAGFDTHFTVGIEYVAEKCDTDKNMIFVYDIEGKKCMCFKERFKRVAQ